MPQLLSQVAYLLHVALQGLHVYIAVDLQHRQVTANLCVLLRL
jgi:hypothetical protein